MSWHWENDDDKDTEVSPGMVVAIAVACIALFGVFFAVLAQRSPQSACFRVLDRNLTLVPLVGFFSMAAALIITAMSTDVGSKLPLAVGGSSFLAWIATIMLVAWRGRVQSRAAQDDGAAVYAVAIDCGSSSSFQHATSSDVYASSMAWGSGGASDGGSGFSNDSGGGASGDFGGATSSSTGDGGSGGGDGGGGCD